MNPAVDIVPQNSAALVAVPVEGPIRSPALKEFKPRKSLPGARPASMGTHRISKSERAEMKADIAELTKAGVYKRRPKTYGECRPGPCPWVSCRHHVFLDVDDLTNAVKLNFPGREITDLAETCSLRVAETVLKGEPMPLEQVGKYLNISMERARQLQDQSLAKMRRRIEPRFQPPPRI
jgi:Sigma-70, region 4